MPDKKSSESDIDNDREIPLAGGNVSQGIVRRGNTVRRPATTYSKSVAALLQHLEQAGFKHSPQYLGRDEQGRDILSYINGDTGIPDYLYLDDAPLLAAARMLRAYHDACDSFQFQNYSWAYSYPDASCHELICHNDFAPYNMIYRQQLPVAIVDFDLAGPGPRVRDIAYLVYWLAPISLDDKSPAPATCRDMARAAQRITLFCRCYGFTAMPLVLDMIMQVLVHMGSPAAAQGMIGRDAAQRLQRDGHFSHWQQQEAQFCANFSQWLYHLSA